MSHKTSDEDNRERTDRIMAETGGKPLNKVMVAPQGDVRLVAFVLDEEDKVVRLTWRENGT